LAQEIGTAFVKGISAVLLQAPYEMCHAPVNGAEPVYINQHAPQQKRAILDIVESLRRRKDTLADDQVCD
jgi:hypothetical protein